MDAKGYWNAARRAENRGPLHRHRAIVWLARCAAQATREGRHGLGGCATKALLRVHSGGRI